MTFTRSSQNLKVATLSMVAALAVNNASYAVGGEGTSLSDKNIRSKTATLKKADITCDPAQTTQVYPNYQTSVLKNTTIEQVASELSKGDGRENDIKGEDNSVIIELFVINGQLHSYKLAYDNIYGLFLEFGERHLSIEEVMERAVKKVEILKGMLSKSLQIRQDKKEYRGIRELKLEVMGGAWSRVIEKIKEDIKRLNEKGKERITIQELRKEYREEAINGFREEYGEKERIFDMRFSKIELDELQRRAENWGYNSSLARNKVANKSLKIIK